MNFKGIEESLYVKHWIEFTKKPNLKCLLSISQSLSTIAKNIFFFFSP